jgi:hypothetical protein
MERMFRRQKGIQTWQQDETDESGEADEQEFTIGEGPGHRIHDSRFTKLARCPPRKIA